MLAPAKLDPKEALPDIAETYWGYLEVYWQDMLGYALAAVAAALLWSAVVGRRRAAEPWVGERWLRLLLVLGLIGLGLWRALQNPSCFDDAYISLRYAENFVAGKGLVWNEGEYVEGYTNFLWVILISLGLWLTPLEAPLIAVLGSLIAFACNLFVVWRISLKIAPPFRPRAFAFPIAVALLAVQNTFTDFGTSGLETGFASLMVNLGVLALVREDSPKMTFWAGFCWIMATLTRPDHAIFYAIGSAVVFGVWVRPAWRARERGLKAIWREGLLPMATYAAPFVIWLIYAAWKLRYYGELLPNTYYAKSAYQTYWSQGIIYAAEFHLSSHLWLVILALVLVWPWRPPSNVPGRRYLAFAVPAIVAYEVYVAKVGGDFMEGRFYVTLIPLILLGGEQVVHELSRSLAERKQAREPEPPAPRRSPLRAGALLMIAVMFASAIGIRMIPPRKKRWKLTDESTHYPIVEWSPIVIDHANYRVAIVLGRINAGLADKDVPAPIIATGSIGMLGYYSNMELIDRLGLTDATVAHREIDFDKRGRPGHDKWADPKYIRERGTHFIRGGGYPKWFLSYGAIRWGDRLGGRPWRILKYDRELMEAIREVEPDVWFHDFGIYIDRYIAKLPYSQPKKVRKEFDFFKTYYFDHNEDPERREAFARYFQWVREGHQPRELLEDGRWDEYKQRAAEASQRERALREARAARKREAAGTLSPAKPKPTRERPNPPNKPKPASDADDDLDPSAEDDGADDVDADHEPDDDEQADDEQADDDAA